MRQEDIVLDAHELTEFIRLQDAAVEAVSGRFRQEMASIYLRFGERGHQHCREDIQFTLDYLRPAVECGFLQALIDYLRWLMCVLSAHDIPSGHVITLLDWLDEFFCAHMSASGRGKITRAIAAAKGGMMAADDGQLATEIDKKMPTAWPECDEFKAALLTGNRSLAMEMFANRLKAGACFLDVELHLVQPALYQVGRDWQENKVSVAQEHLATALATTLLAQQFPGVDHAKANGKKAMFACVEGNGHDVGLRIVADAFELQGWAVQYLGGNVPTRSLFEQVNRWRPDLLGLSVAFPYQLRTARDTISQLHLKLGQARPAIMLGGLAFNAFVAAPMLGADAYAADAEAAVKQGEQLFLT